MSKHLVDAESFRSPSDLRTYIQAQEDLLISCLSGGNLALAKIEMVEYTQELAVYWKTYLNLPGVALEDRNYATRHCAEFIRFRKKHKDIFDYNATLSDPKRVRINALKQAIQNPEKPTLEDMILVRDLRLK